MLKPSLFIGNLALAVFWIVWISSGYVSREWLLLDCVFLAGDAMIVGMVIAAWVAEVRRV